MQLTVTLLPMFGIVPAQGIVVVLHIPLAVNEMVLAVWLIVKGFNIVALKTGERKTL